MCISRSHPKHILFSGHLHCSDSGAKKEKYTRPCFEDSIERKPGSTAFFVYPKLDIRSISLPRFLVLALLRAGDVHPLDSRLRSFTSAPENASERLAIGCSPTQDPLITSVTLVLLLCIYAH